MFEIITLCGSIVKLLVGADSIVYVFFYFYLYRSLFLTATSPLLCVIGCTANSVKTCIYHVSEL